MFYSGALQNVLFWSAPECSILEGGLGTFRAAPRGADSGAVAAGASRQGSCGSIPASRTCASPSPLPALTGHVSSFSPY